MSYINKLRTTLKKRKNQQDQRGLDLRKNYSSFWMDDDKYNRFSGLSSHNASYSTDLVKIVKLLNYRKAVTNFVKIVTKQEIPVSWYGGSSYTDGKSINLTTDIKDTNFDVVVGLALHEASHIVLSDFSLLQKIAQNTEPTVKDFLDRMPHWVSESEMKSFIKDVLNWVEDRRIDHFIFSTSPGYKAYYHKMYDHYWNSKDIHKGFLSAKLANPTDLQHWLFNIINTLNPSFNPAAMPGLSEVVKLIDVRNISRLQSSADSLAVALAVAGVVADQMIPGQGGNDSNQSQNQQDEDKPQGAGSSDTGGQKADQNSENGTPESGGDDNSSNPGDDQIELTPDEMAAIEKAFAEQKEFLRGETGKKVGTNKLQKSLTQMQDSAMTVQTVGEGAVKSCTAVVFDLAKDAARFAQYHSLVAQKEELRKAPKRDNAKYTQVSDQITTLHEAFRDFETYLHDERLKLIQTGLEYGALLGKKLTMHNESRERIDNRLRTGKMDAKRIAHAGYGIEGIFKQIHIDKYKQAVIHISVDASGSMNGNKWNSALKMVAAIGKAISTTQNIRLQVSFRSTTDNKSEPLIYFAYDSKINDLAHLVRVLQLMGCNSLTPEGLCFEAMLKQHMLIGGSTEVDSYFLNISDGEPSCSGYHGSSAVRHTKQWVQRLRSDLKMQVISYFVSNNKDIQESFLRTSCGKDFQTMYGKDACAINPDSVIELARTLNKKFLSAKLSSSI